MKIKIFVLAIMASFIFSSCVKEDIQPDVDERLTTEMQSDMAHDQVDAPQFRAPKVGPPVSQPCETAFFVHNLPAGTVATLTNSSGGIIATFVNTLYLTLATNQTYYILVPGCNETVDFCSCGENYGTLSGPPGTSSYTFNTSSDPTHYSMCAF